MKKRLVLGKKVKYSESYDPSILVRIERDISQKKYNININLFLGFDVWNCYEISFLTNSGLPVVCVGKIVIPCDSKYIVESKSLKLYLNSFNMMKCGKSVKESIESIRLRIQNDLSILLETNVQVYLFGDDDFKECVIYQNYKTVDWKDCRFIGKVNIYKRSNELLKGEECFNNLTFKLYSNLLKSNCPVTNQPDWGSVYVYITSKYELNYLSLLKYIISFRKENHFHEEVCELIFKDLYDNFNPSDLMVGCVYTRRGGIDICPTRVTSVDLLDKNLIDVSILNCKKFRQ